MPWSIIIVRLAGFSLEHLRDDGEFIQHRVRAKQIEVPSFLPRAQASTRPSRDALKRIDRGS